MTLHIHRLSGCRPAPLVLYLKALGILRIVSEQKDDTARGWWQNEEFCLMTKLSRTDILEFFLNEYHPTAVFNPWGARSGFYGGSNEATARLALTAIQSSEEPRLSGFQDAVSTVREAIEEIGGKKPEDELAKRTLVSLLKQRLRGPAAEWLSTVLADLGDDIVRPPIWGSGGNEGSGGYPAAYYAAINECVVRRSCDDQLAVSLFNDPSIPDGWDGSFKIADDQNITKLLSRKVKGPFRQFSAEDQVTAWCLLLMFEGSLNVKSGVSRWTPSSSTRTLASPFLFEPHGVGTSTSCDSDEFIMSNGNRLPGRGEQWFPLWRQPSLLNEVHAFFHDGRCSVGRLRARKPIDAARAVGRLGISRGISDFIRYGYFQRNNLTTHFAVPLGRVRVDQCGHPRANLIDDIAAWIKKLQRLARKKNAPARIVNAERRLSNAVFSGLTKDYTAARWRLILEAAVDIEAIQVAGTAFTAGPIPKLRPAWISAIYDPNDYTSAREVRLALALASGTWKYKGTYWSVRHHFLPLERGGQKFKTTDKRLIKYPGVVATGRDAVADCGEIVLRRFIDAPEGAAGYLPLVAQHDCGATLPDLAAVIDGYVDLQRVVNLARALMALDWASWNKEKNNDHSRIPVEEKHPEIEHPDEAWLAIRLACLPWQLDQFDIKAEHSMVRRLLAGDGTAAAGIARRRLRACGIRVPFDAAITNDQTAALWAAALAFPISKSTARRALITLYPTYAGGSND